MLLKHHNLIETIKNGKIRKVKKLYKKMLIYNPDYSIHENYEEAFKTACSKGFINIAAWLWKVTQENNSPIDIHAKEDLFLYGQQHRLSCEAGHSLQSLLTISHPFFYGSRHIFRLCDLRLLQPEKGVIKQPGT